MLKISKKISKSGFFIVSIILLFFTSIYCVYAQWVEPTAAPPNENVKAPINVGSVPQSKVGGSIGASRLTDSDDPVEGTWYVDPYGTAGISAVFRKSVGIGTTIPMATLQIDSDNFDIGGGALKIKRGATNRYSTLFAPSGPNNALVMKMFDGSSENLSMAWDEDGNVGIGTEFPDEPLDICRVSGTDDQDVAIVGHKRFTAGMKFSLDFEAGCDTGNARRTARIIAEQVDLTYGNLIFYARSTNVMKLMGRTGYVGINSLIGPDRRLDVLDAVDPQLRLTHTDDTVYTDLQTDGLGDLYINPSGGDVVITTPVVDGLVALTLNEGSDQNAARISHFGDILTGYLEIEDFSAGWAGTGLVIKQNNVGIGLNNPSEKLDVAGGLKLGAAIQTSPGTIQWDAVDSDFEGYDGAAWQSLTGGGSGGLPAVANNEDTLRYNGAAWVANSGLTSDGTNAGVAGALTVTNGITGDTISTGLGDFEIGQHLRVTDGVIFDTVDTGQGAYELYAMNQNVRTTDDPTFFDLTVTNKLTVDTIDPVYEIDGQKYASYVADFAGGVRTETSGVIQLGSDKNYIINFENLETGSDLWLFWETSNKKMNDLVVLLAPGFDGSVWYQKQKNNLIISASSSGEVSYRLTMPRHDASDWPNLLEK